MKPRRRALLAAGGAVGLFVLVQIGALALVEPFKDAGFQSVEDPQDPTNSLLYLVVLLVATGAMLLVMRYDVQWLLRGFLVLVSGLISWYVFAVLSEPLADPIGVSPALLGVVGAAAVSIALLVHPEWYVVDGAGVVMGAGAAALFGISFGVLPAIVLLGALAVYDAISVYGTEHMLTLASGVMEMRVPVVLVIPVVRDYSFLDDEALPTDEGGENPGKGGGTEADSADRESADDEGSRDAVFIGLGDAVMPTIMVASAAFFVDAPSLGVPWLALNLPALTAMIGTLCGLLVLIWMVLKGRAHAGLPLLNGGAIGGYLVGALAVGIPLLEALGL